jgi:NADPH-dependent curcumin reductase CurA
VSTEIADPAEGEVLVRNLMMSVDPALRPRMSVGQELNEAISGGAVGRVEKSRNPAYREGDVVQNRAAFREAFLSDGRGLSKLKLEPGLTIAAHMNALGGPGFTAYGGLLRIGALKDGQPARWAQSPRRSPRSKAAMWWARPARTRRSPG